MENNPGQVNLCIVSKIIQREFRTTADGSPTLFVSQWDEHYHSIHGAMQESEHVFMKAGFRYLLPKLEKRTIHILEIGLGTALNAWLTLNEAISENITVYYHALEAYPLSDEEYVQLLFSDNEIENSRLQSLHQASWEHETKIEANFFLKKSEIQLEDFIPKENRYDIIYFDAFAPSAQPELWTETIFRKMFDCLKSGGCLVTYCAKGDVKRAMKAAGFKVEALPGPPMKREMTRAIKP